jgi:nitrogen fixation/metabolism regulation signal transduction histidine kinase
MCRGTPLPEADNPLAGYVIVFDDLTTLLQAQKNAAWSEVARRLAHEIKNPLTPIQLSAERLRHKYLPRLPPADAEGLDNLTRTIIQQVEAMKEMVNAFSDYARSPPMHPKTLDLNSLITDMVEMYHCGKGKPLLQTRLDPHLLPLEGDADRLRQVLHNLIKNALESTGTRQNEIVIETCSIKKATRNFIEVRIQDRGTGFPPEIIDKVFEPYVTTKPKGTGLGLAIVKKIVEEHGGIVWAENWPEGGARVYMRFPVVSVVARNKAEVQEEPV